MCFGWMTVGQLEDEESKLIVYKSVNGLALLTTLIIFEMQLLV